MQAGMIYAISRTEEARLDCGVASRVVASESASSNSTVLCLKVPLPRRALSTSREMDLKEDQFMAI